jgi:hypothetical protein
MVLPPVRMVVAMKRRFVIPVIAATLAADAVQSVKDRVGRANMRAIVIGAVLLALRAGKL